MTRAPMAGVTNAAFRSLCRGYGDGVYLSEVFAARGGHHPNCSEEGVDASALTALSSGRRLDVTAGAGACSAAE